MTKEKEIAGASYIIAFYKEVQNLTHYYGSYLNLMLEIEHKYGNPPKGIEPEVNNALSVTIQTVRLSVHKSYIQYQSIKNTLEEKKKKDDLEKAYFKLKNEFVLNRDALEKYVVSLNALLVRDVIQNLLASSQDLVRDIYSGGAE